MKRFKSCCGGPRVTAKKPETQGRMLRAEDLLAVLTQEFSYVSSQLLAAEQAAAELKQEFRGEDPLHPIVRLLMARRFGRLFQVSCGLMLALLAFAPVPDALAQKEKPKEPLWTHAFDLSCRKFGEAEFTDKTQKFGVEVFRQGGDSETVAFRLNGKCHPIDSQDSRRG